MAVIRDVMPAFDLLQPDSAAEAQKLLEQHGDEAWVMAGGLDSFDWLKDRIKKPKVLVDLSGVEELKGIRATSDGVEIGTMTTLTEIANHPAIQKDYGVLAQAVALVASPQIRNQGTLGGNVSQDVRCWYYQADGRATAQVETFVMQIRRWDATASTRSSAPTAAWPCTPPIRFQR